MSRGMALEDKRRLADNLLRYLVRQPQRSWPDSHTIIEAAAKELGHQCFECWRAYDLLRIMGRIQLNNPNGRHGFQILDTTPLSMPGISVISTKPTDVIFRVMKALYQEYPAEFREVVKELLLANH